MVFQQNVLEKAYFTAKMSGQAIVRPASSDFWKVPLDMKKSKNQNIFCWPFWAILLAKMTRLSYHLIIYFNNWNTYLFI